MLISELTELIQLDAKTHDVHYRLELAAEPPQANVDRARIQQVILNLVRNALEALAESPGGVREVAVRTAPASEGEVEIAVCDTGPGVSPAIAPRLFDPFCTSKTHGTGLGLAMSRTIIRSHQGTLGLSPKLAARCLFYRTSAPGQCGDPMKERSPVVFIVDDDEAVRSSLRLLLKSVGLVPSALASAREFLDKYDPAQPGCLVLDVRMPEMSGLELQEQLNLKGAVLPVIFITGHGDVPMAVEAMQAGAFDFLQKPFRDQDLIDRIQRALDKDRTNRAALNERTLIRERLQSLTPREREVLAHGHERQGEQDHGGGSRRESADRGDSPGACDGENERRLASPTRTHGHGPR